MSVITGVGVRLDLDGPRPVAPPHSLLNTPGVVVEQGDGRWLNGVNLDTYPTDLPVGWDPCSAGTNRTKDDGSGSLVPQFDPFVVYIPATCSTFSLGRLKEMLAVSFDAMQSYGVEHGFAAGVVGMDNPFLADLNMVALAGGAAVTPEAGVSYLENAIGAIGQRGIIHATPAVVNALGYDKVKGGAIDELLTMNGTPIVSGGGYEGIHPVGHAGPSAGQDWIYATGAIEVRLGPISITDLVSSLDRSDNTVTFRAERPVLATWDTALQVGVLVDWTP